MSRETWWLVGPLAVCAVASFGLAVYCFALGEPFWAIVNVVTLASASIPLIQECG